MSFESGGDQRFPYTYEQVWAGLIVVLQERDLKIKSYDKDIGRIECASGISLLSWGENISITVEEIDSKSTRVHIQSGLKIQGNRRAAITAEGRNAKNISMIVSALSVFLKTQTQNRNRRPTIDEMPLDDLMPEPKIVVAPPVQPPPPPKAYFLYLNNEVKGPFSTSQIKALLDVSSVSSETPCCPQGDQEWNTIADYIA